MTNRKEHKTTSMCPFCSIDTVGNHEEKCPSNQTVLLKNWDGWKTIRFSHVQCPYYAMGCIHAGFNTDAENTTYSSNYCLLGYPNPVICPYLKPIFTPEQKTKIIKEDSSTEDSSTKWW